MPAKDSLPERVAELERQIADINEQLCALTTYVQLWSGQATVTAAIAEYRRRCERG